MEIKNKIGVFKYKQIISQIENSIESGLLNKGDKLPSINKLKKDHGLSKDTILMAFNDLKSRGIIYSVLKKGYYVLSDNVNISKRIFLLFDELNSFKEDLYRSFLKCLNKKTQVDLFFHHFNRDMFEKYIKESSGFYTHYVIMPSLFKNTNSVIKNLPAEKVYILDQMHDDLFQYSSVYQDFDKTIYSNLNKASYLIKKYKKLIMIYDNKPSRPEGLLSGFKRFCSDMNYNFSIIEALEHRGIEKGDLYIVIDDENLLKILKKIKKLNFSLAKDIGLISYNDTILKEVLEGGITTISTDFKKMGKALAKIIFEKKIVTIENRNDLVIRNSL
jgi:DNA-binding transcriptional regulator YhcF (GntR family)